MTLSFEGHPHPFWGGFQFLGRFAKVASTFSLTIKQGGLMNRRTFLFPVFTAMTIPGILVPHACQAALGTTTSSSLDESATPQARNQILDEIILARRSMRDFKTEIPDQALVTQIITAGLHAPYVLTAVEFYTDGPFRRFFVFPKDSAAIAKASACMNAKVHELIAALEKRGQNDPDYRERSANWLGRLRRFEALGHVPGVTNAPYFIVIAEHRGIPELGEHALAHCLENMWLKATALGLGFQIISVTAKMGNDPAFCALLRLNPGEWDLMGCALGYAEVPLGPSQRPSAATTTVWMS
jgi:nitroreductase